VEQKLAFGTKIITATVTVISGDWTSVDNVSGVQRNLVKTFLSGRKWMDGSWLP